MGSSPRIEAVPRIGDAMTPDKDLRARLAGLHVNDPVGLFFLQALTDAYASGQLITIADHERAVQAAVAKAVEAAVNAENEACAKLLNNEADDYEADASRFRGGTDPHHYRMDLATTARKYAAAIRSRGVAG